MKLVKNVGLLVLGSVLVATPLFAQNIKQRAGATKARVTNEARTEANQVRKNTDAASTATTTEGRRAVDVGEAKVRNKATRAETVASERIEGTKAGVTDSAEAKHRRMQNQREKVQVRKQKLVDERSRIMTQLQNEDITGKERVRLQAQLDRVNQRWEKLESKKKKMKTKAKRNVRKSRKADK